jgi:hypothetical protein
MRFFKAFIVTLAVIFSLIAVSVMVSTSAKAAVADGKAYYSVASTVTNFPVGIAARNWNLNTKGISLVRVSTCSPTYVPCVDIQQRNVRWFINSGGVYWSETTGSYWSDTYQQYIGYHHGRIDLLFHGKFTYLERLSVICHEFGHYLGLDHDNVHGCMRSYIRGFQGIDPKPYAGDYNRSLITVPDWSWE